MKLFVLSIFIQLIIKVIKLRKNCLKKFMETFLKNVKKHTQSMNIPNDWVLGFSLDQFSSV